MCCSKNWGLGKLKVTIQHSYGLWGDTFTQTDGYIKVFYSGRWMQASTVNNNNNHPVWNTRLVSGARIVPVGSKPRVQVWDDDSWKSDNLLGTCDEPVVAGASQQKTCYLKHG
ncbi:hypothetical protein Y1Q_0015391 [Alligator mississippiensis]|uniref:C2 domain-containing protein n=1 Tax=Alligator mississippiensis TaxID=8496 RepID=A0A151PIT7_ALLMI|nr:hypothetical protein Y1Q_0015391 [Alligator mississippiensis]